VLRTLLGHAAAGRLTVDHEVRPLAEVADAWRSVGDGTASGRVVLVP
jgi:NADPH2:quinone reductase